MEELHTGDRLPWKAPHREEGEARMHGLAVAHRVQASLSLIGHVQGPHVLAMVATDPK